jgi:hypothetical protein
MNLSEHFTLEELTFSSTAVARGIDNTAPAGIAEHLKVTAAGLEKVRALLGHPLYVDSGYRSPALNVAVRGVATSAHCTGYAADFICPAFGSPLEIVHAIRDHNARCMEQMLGADLILFDQLIQEGTWVHISFDPKMRREVLTAHFSGGKASYTHGA